MNQRSKAGNRTIYDISIQEDLFEISWEMKLSIFDTWKSSTSLQQSVGGGSIASSINATFQLEIASLNNRYRNLGSTIICRRS